jgi:hypothetical protein
MDSRQVVVILLLAILSPRADAYSFNFDNTPSQCGTVDISITGTGGTPPYRLGIVPWGGSPLQGGKLEVRKILDLQFQDSTFSFTLPYPEDSQFIAIVSSISKLISLLIIFSQLSDNNGVGSGFASGGVTVPVSVTRSATDTCLPTSEVMPNFYFGTDPIGVLTTCQVGYLTWNSSTVEGYGNTLVIYDRYSSGIAMLCFGAQFQEE